MLPQLNQGLLRYVHIDTPSAAELRPYEVAFWGQCDLFAQAASAASTLITLNSPTNDGIEQPHRKYFFEKHPEFRMTEHRWCYWKIQREGQVSSACQWLFANKVIDGHPCNCRPGTVHENLFAVERERYSLNVQFRTRLLTYLIGQLPSFG